MKHVYFNVFMFFLLLLWMFPLAFSLFGPQTREDPMFDLWVLLAILISTNTLYFWAQWCKEIRWGEKIKYIRDLLLGQK